MEWLSPVLQAIQVISSLSIIALVLLQQGKGADMGSSFGGGSAGSVFGATGAANFLSRMTKWAAIIFFVSTGGLAWIAHNPSSQPAADGGVMQDFQVPVQPQGSAVPVLPGSTAPAPSSEVPVTPNAPASTEVPATPEAPASPQAPTAESPAMPAVPAQPQ